jgi:hypothetical protein
VSRAAPPPAPADTALERVRRICMALPASEEKLSHGAPAFFVKGRMYLSFVDDHHADGRLAVWCKATHGEQQRLVREDAAQFFVPPYVGVSGWVGVRLDVPSTDWIGLSIIVENGWTAVAPARVRDGSWVPKSPPPPPPVRKTTDAKVAREALERVTRLCLALPEATAEREGKHATFRVRKKVFAYFLDNHHGDGHVAVCLKTDKREMAALIKRDPARYFSPSYIGPHGYLGVKLDAKRVDWGEVEARVRASWEAATPKRLAGLRDRAERPAPRRAVTRRSRRGTA